MDHKLATDSMAVERYLLGEMTSDERTLFEKHAFDCDECAAAIRDEIELLDNGLAFVEAEQRFQPGRFMNRVMPVAAAVLAAVVGVQNFVTIPALRQAAHMPVIQVRRGFAVEQSRGTADQPRAGEQTVQYVNIDSEQSFTSVRCELRNASGHGLGSAPIPVQQTAQVVPVLLGPLPAGSYLLVIEGVRKDGNRSPIVIDQYPIIVQGP
jgi:hypothetical protein